MLLFSSQVVSDSSQHHGLQHGPVLPVLHYFQELAQVQVHCINDAIQPSHPQLPLFLLPSIFSSIKVFSNVSAVLIMWQNIGTSASASGIQK